MRVINNNSRNNDWQHLKTDDYTNFKDKDSADEANLNKEDDKEEEEEGYLKSDDLDVD